MSGACFLSLTSRGQVHMASQSTHSVSTATSRDTPRQPPENVPCGLPWPHYLKGYCYCCPVLFQNFLTRLKQRNVFLSAPRESPAHLAPVLSVGISPPLRASLPHGLSFVHRGTSLQFRTFLRLWDFSPLVFSSRCFCIPGPSSVYGIPPFLPPPSLDSWGNYKYRT